MIPLVYLLPHIFYRFFFAIFLAVPIADIIAFLVARLSRKKRTKQDNNTTSSLDVGSLTVANIVFSKQMMKLFIDNSELS